MYSAYLKTLKKPQLQEIFVLSGRTKNLQAPIRELIPEILNLPFGIQVEYQHPFLPGFGLNDDGSPSQELTDFVNSEGLAKIYRLHQKMVFNPDLLELLLALLDIFPASCLNTIFFTKNVIQNDELRDPSLNNFFTKKLLASLQGEIDLSQGVITPTGFNFSTASTLEEYYKRNSRLYRKSGPRKVKRDPFYSRNDYQLTLSYAERNKRAFKEIKKCLISGRKFMRVSIVSLGPKTENTGHVTQVHINLQTKRAQYIDTTNYKTTLINLKAIELFLQEVDPEITLEPYSVDHCYYTLQTGPLCATWSVYIYILHLLNDTSEARASSKVSFKELIESFNNFSKRNRSLLILQYMFYVYKTGILESPVIKGVWNTSSPDVEELRALLPREIRDPNKRWYLD